MSRFVKNTKTFRILFIAIFVVFLIPVTPSDAVIARDILVQELSGSMLYQTQGRGEWLKAAQGLVLEQRDVVKTDVDGFARLLIKGESEATVEIRPNSKLELSTVDSVSDGDDTELNLLLGSVLIKSSKLEGRSRFEVRTPNSIVGIRGTEFEVTVE